jgi:TetR/AcrR family transcriptional repressor of nem operon
LAEQSETFRVRLGEIFLSWSERFADCLREAQVAGEVPADIDARELAEFWLNSWQGALLRAKTTRSSAPLRTFLNLMFGFVLNKGKVG